MPHCVKCVRWRMQGTGCGYDPSETAIEALNGVTVDDLTGVRAFTVSVLFGSTAVNVESVPAESFAFALSSFDLGPSVYWGGICPVRVDGVAVDFSVTSASGDDDAKSFAPNVTAVPKPQAYALLPAGLALIGGVPRRLG